MTIIFIAYIRSKLLCGGFAVVKITFTIEKHYGKCDLDKIVEKLILMKLSNLKLNSGANDKLYCNIDACSTAIHKGESKVRLD